jgi:topoisomerase-4 subunit B
MFPKQSKDFVTYQTGTLLSFVPDDTIFSTTKYQHNTICELIQDRAYLMAGLYFSFYDELFDLFLQ